MGSMRRELRPSIQREDQPTMETKLEQIAAKAVKQRPKSVVREIRTPRSVGTGGGRPPPVTRWTPSNGCPYGNRELISAGGRNPAASGSTSALDGATRAQLGGTERTVARKWRKTGIFPPFRDAPRVKSVVWRNQISSKINGLV